MTDRRSELETLFGLDGQVALVTGASGTLGAECARVLARAGAKVALVARRGDRLESLRDEIEALGGECCCAPADITERSEIESAFELAEGELGEVTILLNCAGMSQMGRAERHSRARWDAVMAVNLTAAFELSQAFATRSIARGGGGRIIHVSSVLGKGATGIHKLVGYAVSKAGLDNLVRQLAVEWAEHDIYVNAIAPGYFASELTSDPSTGKIDTDQEAEMRRGTPMGRIGRPGELDSAVLFLAAPASSYVTGAIIAVDGGWTAW